MAKNRQNTSVLLSYHYSNTRIENVDIHSVLEHFVAILKNIIGYLLCMHTLCISYVNMHTHSCSQLAKVKYIIKANRAKIQKHIIISICNSMGCRSIWN